MNPRQARDGDARCLQGAYQATFVATGGLDDYQVHVGVFEPRDHRVPSIRIIAHTLILRAQANIKMLFGDVDSSVRTPIAIRYPTLRMHVHD